MKQESQETDGAAAAGSRPITILGLGNTLMADDGVGVAVIESLAGDDLGPGVELVSGATAGMALVHHFVESDLVIVVDAISTEAEPGAIFRFDPDDAGVMKLRSNNIHGMGLPYMVTAARLKGARPEVLVFAVQVEDVSPRDMQLSGPVTAAAARVREFILEELRQRA